MASWESYLEEKEKDHLEELLELLRIPSISALPEHEKDVRKAARWTKERLEKAGLEKVAILETGGHPVVYGEWLHQEGKPTVLIYGHFDVQPVDPLHLWTHPPFDPKVEDGRIYARGASDNKGNFVLAIMAVEALLKSEGSLPVNVKFLIEGQEEIGSPELPSFLQKHKDLFKADLGLSTDGSNLGEDTPSLVVGARGLCALQVDVLGAKSDLHSGLYGGTIRNPLQALVEILAALSRDGKIQVEGFFDKVRMPSDEERALYRKVPHDDDAYARELGVPEVAGEPGFTTLERAWIRPTLELNGIWGGFHGEGIKTVLPESAHAKISCRLVPDQDPDEILQLLKKAILEKAPSGVRVEVTEFPGRARPYLISLDHPALKAARRVLEEVYGQPAYITRTGGTVPVLELFREVLGIDTVTVAFGTDDERFHAPDEFFRVKNFKRGRIGYGRFLQEMGKA
ncbi:MAG: dipeptidase [Clostridiales bacterium]|nr:dipeptidase [Clostridiales bacterium]